MVNRYSIPGGSWQTELEVKRSKFMTFAIACSHREQAESFIRELREQHPKANHVCWAYIAGPPDSTVRSMSDDGEPSGTAGMPMLKVLQHSGLGNIAVAVVRYFGGTKLGTGGLQRAYSDAVSQVLEDLPLKQKVSRTALQLRYDYGHEGGISRLFERYDIEELKLDYAGSISASLAVADGDVDAFKSELVNMTAGSIEIIQPT